MEILLALVMMAFVLVGAEIFAEVLVILIELFFQLCTFTGGAAFKLSEWLAQQMNKVFNSRS